MRRDLTSETAQDHYDVEAVARRRGIEPYQVRATQAVGDQLVRDLVADAYRGISTSASMIIPSRSSQPPATKGNGWRDAVPLKPIDTRYIDAQLDAAAHADRVAAVRQRVENAWIESHFEDKGPRIESDWNPIDRKNLAK